MKKIFTALILSISATAFAGPTVGLSYDLDSARNNARGFDKAQEIKVFVAQETRVGTFDLGLIGARYSARADDNANGFEIGYGHGFGLKSFGILGRVAYGRMNQIDPNGGGFTGNSNYVSIGVEGQMPISGKANAFVGYRHRNGLGDDLLAQNRYSAGVDYALTKSMVARVGYAHTRQAGWNAHGLTSHVSYTF